mgnify:CR=1 FL=1
MNADDAMGEPSLSNFNVLAQHADTFLNPSLVQLGFWITAEIYLDLVPPKRPPAGSRAALSVGLLALIYRSMNPIDHRT